MNPIFKILADSVDITERIKQRLISIKTTDEAGMKSDTLVIELDDRDSKIEMPRHGAKLELWLGYTQTGLGKIGIYTVDEISMNGFPMTMTISSKAADMIEEMKAQKTQPFDNITLGGLVNIIAKKYGLIGKTAGALANIAFTHLDQTQESDLHLLTRLAEQHNGVAKVTHDTLIMALAGEAKSLSGLLLPHIMVDKKLVSDYRCSITDRGKYAAVTATWHDKLTAKNISVSTSQAKPAFVLRHTYDDEQKAIEAAQAKLIALQQGTATVEVTLALGNPDLFAESPLVLTGFRPGVSGPIWTVTRLEHNFSNSGFTTHISGEIGQDKEDNIRGKENANKDNQLL
jgi:phage protein D